MVDRVVAGEIKRLMIFAPPQHGKSELVSVRLPAYWMGRRPDDPIILASYGANLAEKKSLQARSIVESQEFSEIFPNIKTNRASRARNSWSLHGYHRGGMIAAGVSGPITGHPAMLGIIDDPFENWEQAQSKTYRDRAWDWWRGTFRTRIWEGGAQIIIMTRWHEDDLCGRLLNDQGKDWIVLRLPALAETQEERDENNRRMGMKSGEQDPIERQPGEALAPHRYSAGELNSIKKDVGSLVWGSEYQGVPRPIEGLLIQRGWLLIVGAAPRNATRVRYWDKAGTAGDGDFTAGVLMAFADGIYYIEDVVRGQWSVNERRKVMLQTAILDCMKYGDIKFMDEEGKPLELIDEEGNPISEEEAIFEDHDLKAIYTVNVCEVKTFIEQEGGSGGKDSVSDEIKMLAGFPVRREMPKGDKLVRGESFIAQAEAGNVRLVRGLWNQAYIDEICAFPNGANDDQWDGTTGAFRKLAGPRLVKVL